MVRPLLLVALLLGSLQTSCIWKLWSKGPPIEERVFDLYGTVETINPTELVIQSGKNEELRFRMADSSIKGGNFDAGAYVHVYYRVREDAKVVTMVVEKLD